MVSRFVVKKFDESTYVVVDNKYQMEMAVCGTYEGQRHKAIDRAETIAAALNLGEHAMQYIKGLN